MVRSARNARNQRAAIATASIAAAAVVVVALLAARPVEREASSILLSNPSASPASVGGNQEITAAQEPIERRPPEPRPAGEVEAPRRFADWRAQYADVSTDDLRTSSDKLHSEVSRLAREVARKQFELGHGRRVAARDMDRQAPRVDGLLSPFSVDDQGTVKRYTLQRRDHPEIYELDDQAAWLDAEIARRSRGKP